MVIFLYLIEVCLVIGVMGWFVFCGVCVGVVGSYNIYLVVFLVIGYFFVCVVVIDGKKFILILIVLGWYCVILLSIGLFFVVLILFLSIYYLFDSLWVVL